MNSSTQRPEEHARVTLENFLSFVAMMMLFAPAALAGGNDRAGTSAATELLIPIGARNFGMGGAAVASAAGLEAIYWNPAGVDFAGRGTNAMFSYRSYIADIGVSFASVSNRFGFGTVALSLRSIGIGQIPVTTEAAPDGTGELLQPNFFVVGATYSKNITDRTSIGASINFINEAFASVSSTGLSFDIGVQYKNLIGVEGLAVGVTVKNLGPAMKYTGPGLYRQANAVGSQRGITYYQIGASEFDLPSVIEIGVSYPYVIGESHRVLVSSTYQNNNYAPDEYRLGAEYSFDNQFFFRGGYIFTNNSQGSAPVSSLDPFRNYMFGFGVKLADVGGVAMDLNYAYVPSQLFTDNNLISINVGF